MKFEPINEPKKPLITTNKTDRVGIILSIICCFHCLITPILFLLSPMIASYISHEATHIVFLLFVVPLALWAFIKHYIIHRDLRPSIFAVVGIIFLLLGIFSHELNIFLFNYSEQVLTSLGSLLLIAGHLFNIKKTVHQDQCHHCHEDHHN